MKRILTLCSTALITFMGMAQDRVIRMPEEPVKQPNIAEMNTGFWCALEANGGSTLMENHRNVGLLSAEFTGGYRLSQWLRIGVGLGVVYYPDNNHVRDSRYHLAMPLYVNARGNILSEQIRYVVPYWSFSVGSALPDGYFVTPTVGLRIGEKRSAFLVGLSYTLRHLQTYPGHLADYSGAQLKVGYEF